MRRPAWPYNDECAKMARTSSCYFGPERAVWTVMPWGALASHALVAWTGTFACAAIDFRFGFAVAAFMISMTVGLPFFFHKFSCYRCRRWVVGTRSLTVYSASLRKSVDLCDLHAPAFVSTFVESGVNASDPYACDAVLRRFLGLPPAFPAQAAIPWSPRVYRA